MSEDIVLSDRNVPRTPLHEELTRLYSQGYMTVSDFGLSTLASDWDGIGLEISFHCRTSR